MHLEIKFKSQNSRGHFAAGIGDGNSKERLIQVESHSKMDLSYSKTMMAMLVLVQLIMDLIIVVHLKTLQMFLMIFKHLSLLRLQMITSQRFITTISQVRLQMHQN